MKLGEKKSHNKPLIIVGAQFTVQAQDVWDLGPMSPVQ